jgi:hypothetical protein
MNALTRLIVFIALVINGMVNATFAAELQIPPLTTVGEKGMLQAEQIFSIESKPTKECHASTIEETPTGLVAPGSPGLANVIRMSVSGCPAAKTGNGPLRWRL